MGSSKSGLRTRMLFLAGALFLAGLDQLTKRMAESHFSRLAEGEAVRIVRGIIYLKPTFNSGGMWGILGGLPTWPFTFLSVLFFLFLLGLIWNLRRGEEGFLPALALMLGGFLGNGIDRVLDGYVTDFIYLAAGPAWLLSTFNLADVSILCGMLWLAVRFVLGKRGGSETREAMI